MNLVERHFIKKTHPLFSALDAACFASKNLFNLANYTIRQEFFTSGSLLSYSALAKQLKGTLAYRSLPAKVSQQVLLTLSKSWKGFFAAKSAYEERAVALPRLKEKPQKFSAKPRLPGYKDKVRGQNLLVFTTQALSQPALGKFDTATPATRCGRIKLSQIEVQFFTQQTEVKQVRVIPRPRPKKPSYYIIEVVYEKTPTVAPSLDKKKVAGIDIGLNNLAAVTSNHQTYLGKRVSRGLFQTQKGQLINADINGSANMIRKVIPNAFADGIQAVVVRPVRVTPCQVRI